jgi:hypothetical protein
MAHGKAAICRTGLWPARSPDAHPRATPMGKPRLQSGSRNHHVAPHHQSGPCLGEKRLRHTWARECSPVSRSATGCGFFARTVSPLKRLTGAGPPSSRSAAFRTRPCAGGRMRSMAVGSERRKSTRRCSFSAFGAAARRHLHNLFAQDDRFAYLNYYQALYPHSFPVHRTGEREVHRSGDAQETRARQRGDGAPGSRRRTNWLCARSRDARSSSARRGPGNADAYDRFLTLRSASSEELAAWKSAQTWWFVRKLAFHYGRPLVLKSPGRTRPEFGCCSNSFRAPNSSTFTATRTPS